MFGFARQAAPALVMNGDIAALALAGVPSRTAGGNGPGTSVAPHAVGVISNARSHGNRRRTPAERAARIPADVLYRTPRTLADLSCALAEFAAAGVELLIVDGGDGTVRDVITCAAPLFGDRMPRLAIVPSGKTNALALDLGLPDDWTIADALAAGRSGLTQVRRPVEILRPGSTLPDLRGFLFGSGAFVLATALAQRTHKAGAIKSLAVGLSLGWGVAQTLFGGAGNVWRRGERVRIRFPGEAERVMQLYMLFGSTLERLPLALKPFGPPRPGLKLLAIEAPPRRAASLLPALLGGTGTERLAQSGYHRFDGEALEVELEGGFILDGELYAGGPMTMRQGPPIRFVVP